MNIQKDLLEAKPQKDRLMLRSSLRNGGVSLNMLAEVASKTFFNQSPNESVSLSKRPKIIAKESSPLPVCDLAMLPPQRLVRLFSRYDGNELKRKFSYTCTFQPEKCKETFISFGSEEMAKGTMIDHLRNHIVNLNLPAENAENQETKTLTVEIIRQDASPEYSLSQVWTDHNYSMNREEMVEEELLEPTIIYPIEQTWPADEGEPFSLIVPMPKCDEEEVIVGYAMDMSTDNEQIAEEEIFGMDEQCSISVETKEVKKNPKQKSKFIGQSNAEKTVALSMIEQIKKKQLSVMDSLECKICRPPRTFTAPNTLVSHYRSHAGIKPFECSICKATFTRTHSLKYHMQIHSNQTNFTCTECGRKFRHPSHFKEHQRRHTGETPFECHRCNSRFKTRNTFKRHLKTRHNEQLGTAEDSGDGLLESSSLSPFGRNRDSPDLQERGSHVYQRVSEILAASSSLATESSPPPTTKRRSSCRKRPAPDEDKEDIVQQAMRCSDLGPADCDTEVLKPDTPVSLNHFTEIAKLILSQCKDGGKSDCFDLVLENNNNVEEFGGQSLDTVVTFQCASAAAPSGVGGESEEDPSACDVMSSEHVR